LADVRQDHAPAAEASAVLSDARGVEPDFGA
jgi:hypothetical protein